MDWRATLIAVTVAGLGCGPGDPESVDLTIEFLAPIDFRDPCELSLSGCPDPAFTTCLSPEPTPERSCAGSTVTAEGDLVQLELKGISADTLALTVSISTEEMICWGGDWYELKRKKQKEFIEKFHCEPPRTD